MVSNEPDVVENNPTNLLNSVFINIVYTISRLVLTAHKKGSGYRPPMDLLISKLIPPYHLARRVSNKL